MLWTLTHLCITFGRILLAERLAPTCIPADVTLASELCIAHNAAKLAL